MKHAFGVGQNIGGLASVLTQAPRIIPTVKQAEAEGFSFEYQFCHKGDGTVGRMGKAQEDGSVAYIDVRVDSEQW